MKLVKPSFEIMTSFNRLEILKHLEKCGRVCYKSEEKITDESAALFIKKIVDNGHEAMIEHFSVSVKIICNRGVTHELVRHRLASYAQESTRFCNYSKDKFGNQITVIEPVFWTDKPDLMEEFLRAMYDSEKHYLKLLELGALPQEARCVLPIGLKTEIVTTANLREWKYIFKMRCSKSAHPQIREIMLPLQEEFKKTLPEIF